MPHTQNCNKNYVYIFVREDLTTPQQAVQTAHAAWESAITFNGGDLPDHPHLVLLAAKNESKLHRVTKHLVEHGIKFVHFYESDLDDQLTAIATQPIAENSDLRAHLRKYQCLKDRQEVLIEAA